MTTAQLNAYRALAHAADQIGRNNYRKGIYGGTRKAGSPRTYSLTPEHAEIVDAMPKVMSGEMSVNDAMALVTQYEVMQQRFTV